MTCNEMIINNNYGRIAANTDDISANSNQIGEIMNSIEMQSLAMYSEK